MSCVIMMFSKNRIISVLLLSNIFSFVNSSFFPNVYPRIKLEATPSADAGDPLILTPYIKKNALELARNLSKVSLTEKIGFTSYSGFYTVNEQHNSNLYFWYFPPVLKSDSAPVVLWLQGGPGSSSLFGLFTENGPLIAKKNGFGLRKYHWAINNHLIFIDNPVGTGFSFTDDDNGYCTDEECVAKGLYNALQQFFTMFQNLRDKEFYISGESYAGKYIPSLAIEIHRRNVDKTPKINLKGLALGNAYCDPVNQIGYGNYLYQHGLIDQNQREIFQQMQTSIVNEIKQENWAQADLLMDMLLDGTLTNFSYFRNYTGFSNYYNFLLPVDDIDMTVFTDLIDNNKVRKSVHVGGLPFNLGDKVQIHLANDILKSVASYFTVLLSHYRVLFYNGQLDIIVAYPLTESFLRTLNFNGADTYKMAPRQIWRVGEDIAGYYKKAGNLTEVLVRNAGHMVPHDQPKWALDLITKFIHDKF